MSLFWSTSLLSDTSTSGWVWLTHWHNDHYSPTSARGLKGTRAWHARVRFPLTGSLLKKLRGHLPSLPTIRELCGQHSHWPSMASSGLQSSPPQPQLPTPLINTSSKDIQLHKHCLVITVKASKSDPFRATCILPVAATGITNCTVRAMREFLSHARAPPRPSTLHSQFRRVPHWARLTTHPPGSAPSCWDVTPRGPPVREPQPVNRSMDSQTG